MFNSGKMENLPVKAICYIVQFQLGNTLCFSVYDDIKKKTEFYYIAYINGKIGLGANPSLQIELLATNEQIKNIFCSQTPMM